VLSYVYNSVQQPERSFYFLFPDDLKSQTRRKEGTQSQGSKAHALKRLLRQPVAVIPAGRDL